MEYYKRLFSFVLIPVTSVISQNVKSMICFTFHLSADLVTVPNNSDNTFLVQILGVNLLSREGFSQTGHWMILQVWLPYGRIIPPAHVWQHQRSLVDIALAGLIVQNFLDNVTSRWFTNNGIIFFGLTGAVRKAHFIYLWAILRRL